MNRDLLKDVTNSFKKELEYEKIGKSIVAVVLLVLLAVFSFVELWAITKKDIEITKLKTRINSKVQVNNLGKITKLENGIKSSNYDEGGYYWYYGIEVDSKIHVARVIPVEELKERCDWSSVVSVNADDINSSAPLSAYVAVNNFYYQAPTQEEFLEKVCK